MTNKKNIIVVKIGGSTLGQHDTTLEDLVELQKRGQRVVVVHGGGKIISDWLKRMGRAIFKIGKFFRINKSTGKFFWAGAHSALIIHHQLIGSTFFCPRSWSINKPEDEFRRSGARSRFLFGKRDRFAEAV